MIILMLNYINNRKEVFFKMAYHEPKVTIIILNFNVFQDTIECLESLTQVAYANYNIILVDNKSTNNSIDELIKWMKKKSIYNGLIYEVESMNRNQGYKNIMGCIQENKKNLILIRNDQNSGFTGGNILGYRFACECLKFDYVMLLNNDTVVDKLFLKEMIKVMEADKKIAIAGPKLYLYNKKNQLQCVWSNVNLWKGNASWVGGYQYDDGQFDFVKKDCDSISGACFLIRNEVIREISFLDDIYFCYWEETDYCFRARRAGYSNAYIFKAKIWHKVAKSSKQIKGHLIYWSTRNNFLFMARYANNLQYISFLIYFFCFKFWYYTVIFLLYRRDLQRFGFFWRGIKDGVRFKSKISKNSDFNTR